MLQRPHVPRASRRVPVTDIYVPKFPYRVPAAKCIQNPSPSDRRIPESLKLFHVASQLSPYCLNPESTVIPVPHSSSRSHTCRISKTNSCTQNAGCRSRDRPAASSIPSRVPVTICAENTTCCVFAIIPLCSSQAMSQWPSAPEAPGVASQ